ncbi:MAG: dihydropteroate synthase [Verrucomicrobiae bacterium]|nr:dihydropteroate synthase [Verrucomicrobiae bacterium]
MIFSFKGATWDLPPRRVVLFGILNVTPDSFSDGGCFTTLESALARARQLEAEGADAIDVGGESTRPGAAPISAAEELGRIMPVLAVLQRHLAIPISVDTSKAAVAEAALAAGASIVNDVSGLARDPRMAGVVAASGAGLILMHSRGEPRTMNARAAYSRVIEEVKRELGQRFVAAQRAGIPRERMAVDPGIGFAKTAEQSRQILRELRKLTQAEASESFSGRPVMVGLSLKSFLGGEMADRALPTLAAEMWAVEQGARFIRTHDVGPLRRALATWEDIASAGLPPAPRDPGG